MKSLLSQTHVSFMSCCVSCPVAKPLPVIVFLVAIVAAFTVAPHAIAKTHLLRENGRTLIEAEDYVAVSVGRKMRPATEVSEECSGKKNLGYLWKNTWFEVEVQVPRMLNYTVSMRVASEEGSRFDVQMLDAAGRVISLSSIDVPKTGSWRKYTNTQDATLSLAAGVQRLRFRSMVDGTNVDFITLTAGADDEVARAQPATNAGPDINPLKGFNSGWWRDADDYASVGFQYLDWRKLEPEDDFFDWAYCEDVLNRAGTQGRHVIIQLVVDWDDSNAKEPVGDSHYKGPDWLLAKVGEQTGPAFPDDPDSRLTRATRYDHPEFIQEATEAIGMLLEHYRDDPRTFVVQVGVLGYWGEWHTFPRKDWSPTLSTKRSILEAYMNALGPDGLTQFRFPDEPGLAPRPGMGYSNGSATLTDQGIEFGDAIAAGRLWKNGPVGGEWPPNVDDDLWQAFFQSDQGYKFIEKGHYSTLSAPEPKRLLEKFPDWAPSGRFMKMHRRMGYNFQVAQVRHLVSANFKQTHIEVDLKNVGIAPFYKHWDVQLAVLNSSTGELVQSVEIETDLRTLGSDETTTLVGTVNAKLNLSTDYQIGIRILQPAADQEKDSRWKLDARNVYVVLANDMSVVQGSWNDKHALDGGWNILETLKRRQPDQAEPLGGQFYPFQGSFRPTDD